MSDGQSRNARSRGPAALAAGTAVTATRTVSSRTRTRMVRILASSQRTIKTVPAADDAGSGRPYRRMPVPRLPVTALLAAAALALPLAGCGGDAADPVAPAAATATPSPHPEAG